MVIYNLNTSYVDIKLKGMDKPAKLKSNLNTSYVDIKPMEFLENNSELLNLNTSYVDIKHKLLKCS